eukprot:1142377-Pelagomonas_calceolata.AAC.2
MTPHTFTSPSLTSRYVDSTINVWRSVQDCKDKGWWTVRLRGLAVMLSERKDGQVLNFTQAAVAAAAGAAKCL